MKKGLIDLLNLPQEEEQDLEEKPAKNRIIRDEGKCATNCICLNPATFYCEWNKVYNPQVNNKPLPVIISGSYHPNDNMINVMERHYKSILKEVLGEEFAKSLINKIKNKDIPEIPTVYDFFQYIKHKPKDLTDYMSDREANKLIHLLHSLENSKIPPYIILGDDCPFKAPQKQTLKEYLKEKVYSLIPKKVRDMY